jgi:hypothetical protein
MYNVNVNSSCSGFTALVSVQLCHLTELVKCKNKLCQLSSSFNNVNAGVRISPSCSPILFASYYVFSIWVSIEGLPCVVDCNGGFSSKDAITPQNKDNLVVCSMSDSRICFSAKRSILPLNVLPVETLFGMLHFPERQA